MVLAARLIGGLKGAEGGYGYREGAG